MQSINEQILHWTRVQLRQSVEDYLEWELYSQYWNMFRERPGQRLYDQVSAQLYDQLSDDHAEH